MIECLCVGAGGCVGAICRYLLSNIDVGEMSFPVITFIINVIGTFVIGFVAGAAEATGTPRGNLMLFLRVGFCGGFTTLSAYALEIDQLVKNGKLCVAGVYGVLTIILALVSVYLGQMAAKAIFR